MLQIRSQIKMKNCSMGSQLFHILAHLKEAVLKAVVESNLFTRCTLIFHLEASGRHTGSLLEYGTGSNSVSNIYLITFHSKFLLRFQISTYSQLLEIGKQEMPSKICLGVDQKQLSFSSARFLVPKQKPIRNSESD